MNLTANFTLEELCVTDADLSNEPTGGEAAKLLYLASYVLQPIRGEWGPMQITSGFRCGALNLMVGGSPTSQHVQGEAADFIPMGFNGGKINDPVKYIDDVFEWIVKRSGLRFGQCIRESKGGKGGKDWIHISLPRLNKPNQQALVYDGKEYKPYA